MQTSSEHNPASRVAKVRSGCCPWRALRAGHGVEQLEARHLMTINFDLSSGSLLITGDEQGPTDDMIVLRVVQALPDPNPLIERFDQTEIVLNGVIHSSDPLSPNLDRRLAPGAADILRNILIEGRLGNDTIIIEDDELGFARMNLFNADRRTTLSGGPGNDSIQGGPIGELLRGGLGKDTLRGGDGDDQLGGYRGTDLLDGGGGADVLRGGRGNDTLSGGDGNDTILSGTGFDMLSGGSGDDLLSSQPGGRKTLLGEAGNDMLVGAAGSDDAIDGGSGDDTLTSARSETVLPGSDSLVGGAGSDTFRVSQGFEQLIIDRALDDILIIL